MIEVLEILPGGRAVVSTEGRFRVVDGQGEIFGELLDDLEADSLVNLMDRLGTPQSHRVSYDALAQSANS